tara:strand:+ start:308 stop:526 length:219 start_codon:yes stop_codon:yes gene_type:complete
MKESNTTLAMEASRGTFAYHLIGTMAACHDLGIICPDPEAEALDYLQTFHAEVLEAEEAKENTETLLTNPSA